MKTVLVQDLRNGVRYEERSINPDHIVSAWHDGYHGHVIELVTGQKLVERDGTFCPCRSALTSGDRQP